MAFSVIDLLEIGVVAYTFDAFLQRDDFIVTGHDTDRAELKTFGEVHRANGDVATHGRDVLVENSERSICRICSSRGPVELGCISDEQSYLMGVNARICLGFNPFSNGRDLFRFILQNSYRGPQTIEDGHSITAFVCDSIDITQFWSEQAICLRAYLVRCAIVNTQCS